VYNHVLFRPENSLANAPVDDEDDRFHGACEVVWRFRRGLRRLRRCGIVRTGAAASRTHEK
jgi:hypothetical protein